MKASRVLTASLFPHVISLTLAGALASCGGAEAPTPAPAPPPPHPPAVEVGPDVGRFATAPLGARLRSLDACLGERLRDWQRTPYQGNGWDLFGTWCRGAARPDCRPLRNNDDVGDYHRVDLTSHVFTTDSRQGQDIGLAVTRGTAPFAWQVHARLEESVGHAPGQHFQVVFTRRWENRLEDDHLFFGGAHSFKVDQTDVVERDERPGLVLLAAYLKSPTSLRDEALALLDRTAAKVEMTLAEHRAFGCTYHPAAHNSCGCAAPRCERRPLTAAEEATQRAAAAAHFTKQRQLIDTEYEALHAALTAAFDVAACF